MSDEKQEPAAPVVTLAGQRVTLRLPEPLTAYRVYADVVATYPERCAVMLRLSWTGIGRPGAGVDPRNVAACGEAVMSELLARGATFREIDLACSTAMALVHRAYVSGAEAVEDEADFFEAPADGSPST